ncbi:MAG: glycosyltransferase family 2 protein [Clostridiales bacterium]|nr:glycosyltransferase family 2 protein [Clostridiales bacterium]
MDNLYIVMPAYNEEANIEKVVSDWYPIIEDKGEGSRMVVADSGSSDRTHEILVSLQQKYPKLEIMSDCLKQHGPKLIAMYKYAVANGADYIFQTDSDGQTDPNEFQAFWELRNQYDAILGNRVVRGDGKSRKFVEKFLCFLLRLHFGVKVKDSNAPFRLMKSTLVNKYVGRFREDYNLPNVMLTTFFAYYKENYTLRVITFKPRQGGKNSINIKKIFKIGWAALADFRAFKREMKKK